MEKERQELIEKIMRQMFLSFRSLKHEKDEKHKHGFFRDHFGAWQKFGHSHRELFFRLIKEKDGISVKEIAESLNITPGAVTQMVDKAVEMGVVKREEDPNDRRSQKIKLSEESQDRIQKFRKVMIERMAPKFEGLTNEELSQLVSLLGKINN